MAKDTEKDDLDDGDSVASDHEGYSGVDPVYKNFANPQDEPLKSDDQAVNALEVAQNERELHLQNAIPEPIHPKDVVHPTNPTLQAPAAEQSPLGKIRK